MSTTEYNLALVQLFRGYPENPLNMLKILCTNAESLFINIGKIRARTVLWPGLFQ
jgi:hypothetical protein